MVTGRRRRKVNLKGKKSTYKSKRLVSQHHLIDGAGLPDQLLPLHQLHCLASLDIATLKRREKCISQVPALAGASSFTFMSVY